MAKVKINPLINSISGRLGDVVFYNIYGRTYIRVYVKPRNPDTAGQKAMRRTFAEAVKSWQSMSGGERENFNKKATGLPFSGYNLYISEYLKIRISVRPDLLIVHSKIVHTFNDKNQDVSVSAPFQLRLWFDSIRSHTAILSYSSWISDS